MAESEVTKLELIDKWEREISVANKVFNAWVNRFRIEILYQYYEGYQWYSETDFSNRPYVCNMIYTTIETKLPNMIFSNPKFTLRPQPYGETYNFEEAAKEAQIKEDTLNFVCERAEFGLGDKHELAILDAFFGFGVLETRYSENEADNPYLSLDAKNPLNKLYCKQIPFDQFRVSANANWDLSKGRWYGYYDFVPFDELTKYGKLGVVFKEAQESRDQVSDFAAQPINISAKVLGSDSAFTQQPAGHAKIWNIWDFKHGKYIKYCDETKHKEDRFLEYKDFDHSPISILRFGKRRKGWYPLPPVFNWLSPQDEINEIRETQRIHRKRFNRKYEVLEGKVDQTEIDKAINGPDGTFYKVKVKGAINPLADPMLDSANQQSLIVSYDDINRVTGTSSEQRGVSDRTTATQAGIINQRSQIRESKDLQRVGEFVTSFGRTVLRELGKIKGDFWTMVSNKTESTLGAVQTVNKTWRKVPGAAFNGDDGNLDVEISSISPIYQQQDKQDFLSFLAIITQYEILSFSPELLREAAYRCGYRNQSMLAKFQEMAQLASLGRIAQLKGMVQSQGPQPGQLAEQQTNINTPPDMEQIRNMMFNNQGLEQPQ